MPKAKWPVHGEITGPVVMIGFGSIGRGTLPLIERHFKFDRSRMVVIDPSDANRRLLDERGIAFVQESVTRENYERLLGLLRSGQRLDEDPAKLVLTPPASAPAAGVLPTDSLHSGVCTGRSPTAIACAGRPHAAE